MQETEDTEGGERGEMEGVHMVKQLQQSRVTINDRLQDSEMRLFKGSAPIQNRYVSNAHFVVLPY